MPQVIPFPSAQAFPPADIAALSARLVQVETAETNDEELMDLLLEAEARALAALTKARAETVAEAALKLATVVRRAGDDRDGPLSAEEMRLLRSTLRDLQRLNAAPAVAAVRA